MREPQLNTPDEQSVPRKKKKKGKIGRVLILLALILVIGAGVGYYFYERSQPAKELETYHLPRSSPLILTPCSPTFKAPICLLLTMQM